MKADKSRQCLANLRMTVLDFGPDCKIAIDDKEVVSLADHFSNGCCEPFTVDYCFTASDTGRTNFSSEVKVEVRRTWKGADRLVFTRYIRIVEGDNDLAVSFYGIKNARFAAGIFAKQAESSYTSDSTNSA